MYTYDAAHRLTDQRFASGRTVHFRYDAQGRCTESWVDQGGAPDLALDDDVPEFLADGTTRARGMLHVALDYDRDTITLYDSRQTKRFDHNAHGLIDVAAGPWIEALGYDDAGHLAAYSDPEQRVTRFERDRAGRLLSTTDPAGHRASFRYDDDGRLVEAVDKLGATLKYTYDPTGGLRESWDQLGTLLRCVHDARGLLTRAEMPNGAVTEWHHDDEGNLVTLIEPHGKPRRFEVDDIGLVQAFTDEEGHRTVFGYDATNTLRTITLPNGGVSRLDLDPEGRLVAYTTPDGGTWRLAWAGHHCVHMLTKPTGEQLHLRYDREGNLVRVINERGEHHHLVRDLGGRIVAERHFDGREHRYRLDLSGRLARHTNAAGEPTDFERDPCGRVTKRTFDGRTSETFAYDPAGRLVRAENPSATCEWDHDARGNLVRETTTHGRRRVTIDHTYNAVLQRTSMSTSSGLTVRYHRDLMGNLVKVELPGPDGGAIERTFDTLGRELVRALPGGARILNRYDAVGAMIERRVVGPSAASASRAVAPSWVGPLPEGTTFAEGFATSPGGELLERVDSTGRRERFEYDSCGRLLRRWQLDETRPAGTPPSPAATPSSSAATPPAPGNAPAAPAAPRGIQGPAAALPAVRGVGRGGARVLSPRRDAPRRGAGVGAAHVRAAGRADRRGRCVPEVRPLVRAADRVLRGGRRRPRAASIVTQGSVGSQIESVAEPTLDPRNGESLECRPPRGGSRPTPLRASQTRLRVRSLRFNPQPPPPRHAARVTST